MQIYPKHILPCYKYHIIEQADLLAQSGLVLIRHVESQDVIKIEESGILHPDCIKIQSDHLRDLSNNLLGVFTREDIFYGIIKEHRSHYCALWNENSEGLMPSNQECFKDEERGSYFIPIDNLLKLELPEVQEQVLHFMVFHTPTKCNFWHVSIRLLNGDNREISTLDMAPKKKSKIWKSARDFLIMDVITQTVESYSSLSKEYYLKEEMVK